MLEKFEEAIEKMKENGSDYFFIKKAESFVELLHHVEEKHLISHVFEDVWSLLEKEIEKDNKVIKHYFLEYKESSKDYHHLILSSLFNEVSLVQKSV